MGKDGYRLHDALISCAYMLPGHLYDIFPITLLIGAISALARLAQTSEYTILRTGGLGPGRALRLLGALGLLAADGQLDPARLAGFECAGELSLAGELRPVRGLLPLLASARRIGLTGAIVPAASATFLAESLWMRLLIGWGVATTASVAGLYWSYQNDFPTGATIVCALGISLLLAGAAARFKTRKSLS